MDFEKFNNGTEFSVGAELELRLLYEDTLKLANEYEYIYENIDEKYKENITPEFLKSMVEINSPVFDNAQEVKEYFEECIKSVKRIAAKKSLLVSCSGSYSLKNNNIEINENPRYEAILNEHQILLRNFNICGLHIHIGFKDFNQALQAYNFSIKYLPLFLAMSCSSPFFNEESTGLHSYRQILFDELPKAGLPEYFNSYEEMKDLYDLLENTGVINTPKDVWWDVRIQPTLKTLEFRICDAMNDFDRIEIIVALVQAICKFADISKIERLPKQILKQNIWSAIRYGLKGDIIFEGSKYSIQEAIKNLSMELFSVDIIDEDLQMKIEKLINKDTISEKMIKVYEQTNDMKEVEKVGVFK